MSGHDAAARWRRRIRAPPRLASGGIPHLVPARPGPCRGCQRLPRSARPARDRPGAETRSVGWGRGFARVQAGGGCGVVQRRRRRCGPGNSPTVRPIYSTVGQHNSKPSTAVRAGHPPMCPTEQLLVASLSACPRRPARASCARTALAGTAGGPGRTRGCVVASRGRWKDAGARREGGYGHWMRARDAKLA